MYFRNEKGLTLIEAVAATLILSMVVLTFVTLSSSVNHADHTTDQRNEALRIAELNLHYARDYFPRNNSVPNPPIKDGQGYSVKIQLTDMVTGPGNYSTTGFLDNHVSLQTIAKHPDRANPQIITVTVSWGAGT
jgi:hypothetical protein